MSAKSTLMRCPLGGGAPRRRISMLQSAATAALTLSSWATSIDAFRNLSRSQTRITSAFVPWWNALSSSYCLRRSYACLARRSGRPLIAVKKKEITCDRLLDMNGPHPVRIEQHRMLLHSSSTVSPSDGDAGHGMKQTSLDDWDEVLPFENGSHNSATIFIPSLLSFLADQEQNERDDPFDSNTFRPRLEATIATCRELKKSSLWAEVHMSRASLIEHMSEFGLRFHHAEGEVASLYLWLQDDAECKIPTYATHQVGVGALVVNSKNEILCVREMRNNYLRWKIPGGLAELGEQIDEAAMREVMEETGIRCQFRSVLGVRHTHGIQFGRSDLYFVCRLEPVEEVDEVTGKSIIPDPVPQEGEIESAAWVPLDEYKAMVNAKDGHPMMKHLMKLHDQDWLENDIQKTIVKSVVPGRKPNPIYHAPLRSSATDENNS